MLTRTGRKKRPSSERRDTNAERDAAEAARLRYVHDDEPGIQRERRGRSFRYLAPAGMSICDRKTLARIQALAIPPAWNDVWICSDPNGHLQATGRDARGRQCYIHPAVIDAYLDRSLLATLKAHAEKELRESLARLPPAEAAVLALLKRRLENELDRSAKAPRRRTSRRSRARASAVAG